MMSLPGPGRFPPTQMVSVDTQVSPQYSAQRELTPLFQWPPDAVWAEFFRQQCSQAPDIDRYGARFAQWDHRQTEMEIPMSHLIPNLEELGQLLEKDSDAAQLAAAFSVASLAEAQANLRKIATGWDGSEAPKNSTSQARS